MGSLLLFLRCLVNFPAIQEVQLQSCLCSNGCRPLIAPYRAMLLMVRIGVCPKRLCTKRESRRLNKAYEEEEGLFCSTLWELRVKREFPGPLAVKMLKLRWWIL